MRELDITNPNISKEPVRPEPDPSGPLGPDRAPKYVSPALVRIKVQTTRMTLGQFDAKRYCTVHTHNVGPAICDPA